MIFHVNGVPVADPSSALRVLDISNDIIFLLRFTDRKTNGNGFHKIRCSSGIDGF